jgi:hypothetical protein
MNFATKFLSFNIFYFSKYKYIHDTNDKIHKAFKKVSKIEIIKKENIEKQNFLILNKQIFNM